MKKNFLVMIASAVLMLINAQKINAQQWKLAGNNDATTSSRLGTKNNVSLRVITNNKERLTIDSIGRVGVGVTTPEATFQVHKISATPYYEIMRTSANLNGGYNSIYENNIYRGYWGSYAGKPEDMDFGTGSTNSTGNIHFTISAVPKVTIDSIGRMGIGVTNPFRKLEVNAGDLRIKNNASSSRYLEFVNARAGINDWRLEHFNGLNGTLYISSSSNDFGSYIDRASFDTGYYKFYVYGNALASGFWVDSDSKLKKDIKDVTNATEIINRLRPRTYNFKTEEYKNLSLDNNTQIGFIAQELETVLPQLVHASKQAVRTRGDERIEEEVKSVNYIQLIPILTKALQEQNEKIERLQALVENLATTSEVSAGNTSALTKMLVSNAVVEQNKPNPFNTQTSIEYNIPTGFVKAMLTITDNNGKAIKQVQIKQAGKGTLTIDASLLTSGVYYYSLVVDGKNIGSKQMIIAR